MNDQNSSEENRPSWVVESNHRVWYLVPVKMVKNLYVSYPRRTEAIIQATWNNKNIKNVHIINLKTNII